MKDILITSSVLILAMLILRQVFRKAISRRVQYALWGLVLLRLLVPASLPAMEHNVLTTAEPVQTTVSQQMDNVSIYLNPIDYTNGVRDYVPLTDASTPAVVVRDSRSETVTEHAYIVQGQPAGTAIMSENGIITWYAKSLPLNTLLTCIWCIGIAVMACWLVISNLRFWRKLRKGRMPYIVGGCKYPVYLCDGLPSPCLFGLFRPAIYLTSAAAASPESLRHVLAHESTHARHLDPLWSLLRGVCLAVYWFDPLVWIAAVVSRTDCELACDEGALRRLGEGERIAYGRTLLSLIPVSRKPVDPLLSATTMTSGKRQLKDRITRIAENRQTMAAALFAAVTVAALLCAVTFTGAKPPMSQPLTAEELAQFNIDFFGEAESASFRRQFLTSMYAQPEDIDMFQLFYNGAESPDGVGEEERQLLVEAYYDGTDPEVDLTKLPAQKIDRLLKQYTGLTLAETQALGMEQFHYLADYDAYYHFHGDTNAIFHFSFAAGEREGNLMQLYYRADGLYAGGEFGQYGDGWCCLTLEELPAGAVDGFPYHFVSNQLCERPEHLLSDVTALTGTELTYFNEEFFNNDTDGSHVGGNIHNQFLTSVYVRPEDIDLFELFYCGTGFNTVVSEEELQLLGALTEDGEQICPTDKLTVADMDQILLANTGLTLAETNQINLGDFQYLPEYEAYYHTHGDTNYFHSVNIAAGMREGSTIRLYYPDSYAHYADTDWLCVTLEEQEDGSYWFVSNQPSEKPAIPTALPEGDPVLTIPLTDLTPYEPEVMPVEHHSGDYADRSGGGWRIDAENSDEVSVSPYRSTDGNLYAAIIFDSVAGRDGPSVWEAGCFFTFPENNSVTYGESTINTFFFSDLFGHNGWQLSYSGQLNEHSWTTFTDYYYFENDRTPVLLARTHGLNNQIIDLDGDGTNELINEDNQLFFQRDGQLYEADITALLREYWPELNWWDYSILDTNSRCLMMKGFVNMPEWGENAQADFTRYVYYDGENLLVYDNLEDTEDHAAVSVLNSDIPEQVLADAKTEAREDYEASMSGGEGGQDMDDWRVSYLELVNTYTEFPTNPIEVYRLGYQYHAAKPAQVMLVGGMYVQEDGWVGGFNGVPYLVYSWKPADDTRTRLKSFLTFDYSMDSIAFRADLCRTLLKNKLIQPVELSGKDLCHMSYMNGTTFINELAAYPWLDQENTLRTLVTYIREDAGEYEQGLFQDTLEVLQSTTHLTESGTAAYRLLLDLWNDTGDKEPPTEEDIHSAILSYRSSQTAHKFDFYAEAHRVLDSTYANNGDLYTVYAMVYYNSYSITEGAWQVEGGGYFPAAITFAYQDGKWQLDDYWEPGGGAYYSPDIQRVFPAAAAETALNGKEILQDLSAKCDEAAQQYAMSTWQAPSAKTFAKADVEFSNRVLAVSQDEMTYEERLAWIQNTEIVNPFDYISCGQYAEGGGAVAYVGQWIGTPHVDQYGLSLRFADGTQADLPLPSDGVMSIARPGSMEFQADQFIYTVQFATTEVTNEGQSLIHLAGTYCYTVDLSAKTVSLTMIDN